MVETYKCSLMSLGKVKEIIYFIIEKKKQPNRLKYYSGAFPEHWWSDSALLAVEIRDGLLFDYHPLPSSMGAAIQFLDRTKIQI